MYNNCNLIRFEIKLYIYIYQYYIYIIFIYIFYNIFYIYIQVNIIYNAHTGTSMVFSVFFEINSLFRDLKKENFY